MPRTGYSQGNGKRRSVPENAERVTQICVTAAHASAVNGDEKTFEASVLKAAQDAGLHDKGCQGVRESSDRRCDLRRYSGHEQRRPIMAIGMSR